MSKKVIILKDSQDTYELQWMDGSGAVKYKGRIFEHDLVKFIKDIFNQ